MSSILLFLGGYLLSLIINRTIVKIMEETESRKMEEDTRAVFILCGPMSWIFCSVALLCVLIWALIEKCSDSLFNLIRNKMK